MWDPRVAGLATCGSMSDGWWSLSVVPPSYTAILHYMSVMYITYSGGGGARSFVIKKEKY